MVSKSILIRLANRKDMLSLVSMAEEFADYLATLGEERLGFDSEASLAHLLKHGFVGKPLFSALLAEDKGKPVGYAIYNFGFWADTFQGMIFMTDLFVREDWRSKGVGQLMMKELRQVGRENDCDLLVWTVWTNNSPAQKIL